MVVTKTFKLDYGVQFMDSETGEIAKVLEPANFLPGSSIPSDKRHTRIAMFVLCCPLD